MTTKTAQMGNVITRHGFIFATSVAMFVHSTWTFNTLFAGKQPHLDGSFQAWIPYVLWVVPGALIAAAIDIGQVQTSSKLMRAKDWTRRLTLSITFIVLAIAGYYLQWFHLIHHMPDLAFGAGLSTETENTIRSIRDAAIWIIPALLPISTILYTMSEIGEHVDVNHAVNQQITTPVVVETEPIAQLEDVLQNNSHIVECASCGWSKTYDNELSATRGLATHKALHCTALHPDVLNMNGKYHVEKD